MFSDWMRRVAVSTVVAAALAVAGCNNRSVGANDGDGGIPDGQVGPDGRINPDGGDPDGGTQECDVESHGWLTRVELSRLELLQGAVIVEGQTMRFAAGLDYGGCDVFAQVRHEVDPNARVIHVEGYRWDATGELDCPEFLAYAEEIIALSDLQPGNWLVVERPLNGPGLETSFTVLGCDPGQDCHCTVTNPPLGDIDDPCVYNCQCLPGLQCLSLFGHAGPYLACGRNCAVNADCLPGETCRYVLDGPIAVCGDGVGDNCEILGCPPGMVCVVDGTEAAPYCQATFGRDDDSQDCACDAECALGLRCVDWPREGEQQPQCHFQCRGDSQCPPGWQCGDTWLGALPLCYLLQW